MLKRQWIISGAVSLLILLGGTIAFRVFSAQKKSTVSETAVEEELVKVKTASYSTKDVSSTIDIDGRLNAVEKINVSAEVPGPLVEISKKWRKGSAFSKGDLLFKIDNEDVRLALFAQRSSLLNAITQIMPDLKFDYPEAFEKWKSYLDNFNVESQVKQLPKVTDQQEKYFIAGKNIYNLYYSIKAAEDRIKDYQIYAPFSGVFLTVNAYPGSLASPGVALGQLMNTTRYELEAPISAKDFKFIKRGQRVQLESVDEGKKFSGNISRISSQIDQTTQSIPIFISVRGKGLRDGMYLQGSLQGSQIQAVAEIPVEAMVNQQEVYILKDSVITEKQIEVVFRGDRQLLVKGLSEEESIIISGINSLSPGQKAIAIN